MSKKLSREEAIVIAGEWAVRLAEEANCEQTGRVGDLIEWMAVVGNVVVYYYTNASDQETVDANGGDWGAIDWTPDHYRIIED